MSVEVMLNLSQSVVLLFVFFETIRQLVREQRNLRMVFFAFAVACVLLSNFYWLAYDILRPETRMPFAANEIAEWALFLLLGTSLRTKPTYPSKKLDMLCTALFAEANAALWIAWSGEWVEDVLTGAVFVYFLCRLVAQLRADGVFARWEWRLLAPVSFLIVAAQAAIFFVPDAMRHTLDLLCYCLLFGVAAFLFIKAILVIKRGGQAKSAVGCAFSTFAWSVITMYMSAGWFYIAALLLATLCYPMMLLALREEAVS